MPEKKRPRRAREEQQLREHIREHIKEEAKKDYERVKREAEKENGKYGDLAVSIAKRALDKAIKREETQEAQAPMEVPE
jgi:hypothetical protein